MQWDLAAAYAYQEIEAGVLTASKIAPNLTCSFMDKEPITRVPKSILITRYPISGQLGELLVANIHAINFTMGYTAFQRQCDRLENVLATHKGPMIVSGFGAPKPILPSEKPSPAVNELLNTVIEAAWAKGRPARPNRRPIV